MCVNRYIVHTYNVSPLLPFASAKIRLFFETAKT